MRPLCSSIWQLIEVTLPLTIARASITSSSSVGMMNVDARAVAQKQITASVVDNIEADFQETGMLIPEGYCEFADC